MTVDVSVSVPFNMCKDCPYLDIEKKHTLYADGVAYHTEYACKDSERCQKIVENMAGVLYRQGIGLK